MTARQGGTLKRADPYTIQDKVLVGYQGWFTCGGDGQPIHPGHHGWLHWFHNPIPTGGRPNVDLWPDTSEYDPSELYPAPGLTNSSGDPVYLFSSRNPKTVQRHFHWMALHGVDGAFLQRFAGQCEIKPGSRGVRDLRDEVGDRVREAAEAEGRVYAIMYDVSGVSPDKIQDILEQDWKHLIQEKHLLDSPNYLREKGRPVVALWGFGFNGRNHTPELVRAIAGFFRSFTPGGVYLVAGTPGHWRTSTSDADRNPEFVQVWTQCFDAISPWTVGRYGNDNAHEWGQGRLKHDADYLNKLASEGGRKVDYIPVVLPGGSGFNLSQGKWHMNDMKREGGRFLWTQVYNAQRAGVRTIYGAMWDEYDEGTAFMPIVSYASQLPVHPSFRFIALDIDGHDLPSDWYMRVLGYAAEAFHAERVLLDTFPVKELQDYWSTRPHYEAVAGRETRPQADVEGVTRAFGVWDVSGGNAFNDVPPPYSLEDTPPPQPPSTATQGPMHAPPVRQDTRPGSSSHAGSLLTAAAGIAAVGVVAHTLSSSSSAGALPSQSPPPVRMSSRPVLPLRPSSEMRMSPSPRSELPQAHRTGSLLSSSTQVGCDTQGQPTYEHGRVPSVGPPAGGGAYRPPPGPPSLTSVCGYDTQRQPTHEVPLVGPPGGGGGGGAYRPPPGPPSSTSIGEYGTQRQPTHEHGRVSSVGPPGGGAYRPPLGPPSLTSVGEHGRGRQRRRSRSRSRSSSRSRSRSSSRKRRHGVRSPPIHHGHGHGHGHSHSIGPSPVHGHGHSTSPGPFGYPSYTSHGHGHHEHHGHSHSLASVGSPQGMTFPGAGTGAYDAYYAGMGAPSSAYSPVHSHPVGHGGSGLSLSHAQGQGPGQGGHGAYPGPYPSADQSQGGYGYGPGMGPGQGYGQGQGYDAMGRPQQQPGYRYNPSTGYYSSYAPNSGPGPYPGSGGSGGGGMQGSIATALNAVEGIAGAGTRRQLEKTVKSLSGAGGSLLNKFKS